MSRWVTLGNVGPKTVTGHNHNFYCIINVKLLSLVVIGVWVAIFVILISAFLLEFQVDFRVLFAASWILLLLFLNQVFFSLVAYRLHRFPLRFLLLCVLLRFPSFHHHHHHHRQRIEYLLLRHFQVLFVFSMIFLILEDILAKI